MGYQVLGVPTEAKFDRDRNTHGLDDPGGDADCFLGIPEKTGPGPLYGYFALGATHVDINQLGSTLSQKDRSSAE
jgi:hypothetical protein